MNQFVPSWIGSSLTKRPMSGEYQRSPFCCKPVAASSRLPWWAKAVTTPVESAKPPAPRVAVTRPNWA
jgi:hypothetical protein